MCVPWLLESLTFSTSLPIIVLWSLGHVWLFCNSMDCSPPGSSVHGILPARILEWVTIPSSRGFSWPRDQTCVSCGSCIACRSFMLSHQKLYAGAEGTKTSPFTIIHIITAAIANTANILSWCHQRLHFQYSFLRPCFLFHCSSLALRLRKTGLIDHLSAKCKHTPFW